MPDPLTLLGATAAGAQFVGYSIKSLIELITLLQGFRDTPEQIHLLLCDAKKSIERLSQLRDYVQTPNAHIAESLTASQIQRIQQTTNDASEPMNQLHALLLPLAQRADGTPHKGVTKSWNTVKSLLRMREVENKLSRIQRLHSDLLQELQISDLQLQATMSSNIAKLSTSINSFGSGLMSIETATTLANSEIRHTRNDIAMLTTDQKILVSELTAMRPAFDEVYAANHHILAREEQNSHRLQSLESTMEIILKSLTDPSRDRPNFDHVSITRISDADKEDIVRGVSRSLVERPSALRGVLDASTSTIAHPMPKRGNRHSDNKKTTSFALRLRPLLDRTLKLSFSINISLWAYRSVKRSESPIFQRLDEASEDIRKAYRRTSVERPQSTQTLQSGIEIILTKLLDNLRRLSKSEGACLADRDEIGRSPFQNFIEIFGYLDCYVGNYSHYFALYWSLFENTQPDFYERSSFYLRDRYFFIHKQSESYYEATFEQYIMYCLQSRQDEPTISQESHLVPYYGCFALEDAYVFDVKYNPSNWNNPYDVCQWSQLLNSQPKLTERFNDPSGLAKAIVYRRSQDLISCYKEWEAAANPTKSLIHVGLYEYNRCHISPVELASGWPEGVHLLLSAGVVARHDALAAAMACRNYDTIGMLIDEHYTYAFTAAELLQVCVDSVYGWQGMVVYKMVARAISGRRTALLHLAISNLSKPQLEDLGYREGELPDTCAFEMYETLLRHNVRIPYALAVETPGSLHHFAAIEGSWVIGLLAALYDHGFREIDVMHKNETPLQKFDRYNHEAQRWFLSKGAKPRIPGFFDGVTDVQFGMAYYFALFHLDTSGYKSGFVLPPVDQCLLLRQWTEWYKSDLARSRRDQCRCFCSSRGCSPVHFFVCRQSAFGESTPTDLVLRLWCKNTNCSIANVEDLYDERCRLEIFERLEMKHTCHSHARLRHGQFRYGRLSAAEIKEIRREDEWANCQLELLMKIYMISRNKFLPHHPNLGDFAKHLWHWWHELDVILPELRDYPWRNWQTREKHVLHALKDAGYIQEAEPATSGEHAIPDFLDVIKLHFAHYLDKRNVQSARPRRRTKRLPWRVRRRYLGTPRWLK